MNRNWLFGGLFGFLALGVIIYLITSSMGGHFTQKIKPTVSQNQFGGLSSHAPPQPKAPPSVPSGITVPSAVAKDPTALAYFLAEMTPISFYGKVVDTQNHPIGGAMVKFGIADKIFENPTFVTKQSDSNGLFSINNVRGLSLGVYVSKDGYYQLQQSSQEFGFAKGAGNAGSNTTPAHPAIFVLQKKGAGVHLIVKSVSSHLRLDGTPAYIDLEAGKITNSAQGDLEVQVWSKYDNENPNVPYDWTYSFSVLGGGLLDRANDLDFEAPDGGYQASDEKSFTVGQAGYQRTFERQFFLKLADGRYARMDFSIGNSVNINAYINPTPGDKNLEPTSN